MKLPLWMNPYTYLLAAFLVFVGWVYWKGGKESRGEVKTLAQTVKDTAKSNEISRGTQDRIGIEGYENQQRTERRVARVQDRIATVPDGGQLDADILRESREAWEAAVRAACRVRRTIGCPEARTATGKH